MKSKQLKKYLVKANKLPKSLKAKKLKTANTVINKNTEINQAWLDANPGPYAVRGGSKSNVIEISFLENLNVKQNTYFMIETDYVNINGNEFILNFENIKDYVGLVQNTKFSHIIVKNIKNTGKNSSLLERSGWFLGSNYGTNSIENKVEACVNFLPISPYSGGIVGENSNIHAITCTNEGEFKLDNSKESKSGGIAAINVSGKIENCINNIDLEGYAGGIVHLTNKDLDIINCENYGNLNNVCAGIITFIEGTKSKVNILNCLNDGDLSNTSYGIVVAVRNSAQVLIKDCINYGNCLSFFTAGIMQNNFFSDPEVSVEITGCTNYGNLNKDVSSGISLTTKGNFKINNCYNKGQLLGNQSSGIVFRTYSPKNTIIQKCQNYGTINGQNSGGISTQFCPITVKDCINHGVINGVGCGGIFGAGTPQESKAVNCINNATINGENSAGIFGAWCQGTAKNCQNAGKLIGLSAQPIFGFKSTGIIE